MKKNYKMIINAQKCVGCHACEVACKQEYKSPLGFFRTMTLYLDEGTYPKVKRDFLPLMCRQCDDALCQKACTKGAITKENGIVKIDSSKCDGCQDCVSACSIGAVYINPYTNIAEKCNLCEHRLEIGLQAACEATCVANAITIITDEKDIPSNAVGFKNHKLDKPSTLHIGANEKMKNKIKHGRIFSATNYEIYTWAE
ncbi:4Fe-4S dicluster domain-containing protein [Arcobacter sp. CECT 8985]|uniref:4Fe-4S dicluster domain-containing protein n=1 Tax=Arcobacter sp. CECT 8985 TaxID=1935424 RepID=UPI00100B50C8|nr:4Fe-4S dicluster domain-containing protein [Arcobacter sp. CECT 8985]RXJ87311.1 4Fe-4S ferredoxin [Arcobacter sp. CECT 8985]